MMRCLKLNEAYFANVARLMILHSQKSGNFASTQLVLNNTIEIVMKSHMRQWLISASLLESVREIG